MNVSVNGESQVPPGFRFHPTEEELLHYYLRKKIASLKIDLDVIPDIDLNKLEPWDIQEKCKIGSTPQNDWYFFSHKDKKYPTGTRTNRATAAGFWKATGRDKVIHTDCRRIGLRKTLVFYRGRAPRGQKSDWIMHEYRLDDNNNNNSHDYATTGTNLVGETSSTPEEGWVVCKVFKKKHFHKGTEHLQSHQRNDGVLDQILTYMGRSSNKHQQFHGETKNILNNNTTTNDVVDENAQEFLHLPALEYSPGIPVDNSFRDMLTQTEQFYGIDFSLDCYEPHPTVDDLRPYIIPKDRRIHDHDQNTKVYSTLFVDPLSHLSV